MSDVVLITVAGQDRAGITSVLTGILANYDINVLDIGQSVIHESLSLGILIESPAAEKNVATLEHTAFKDIFIQST